jgi:hypothetical protein
LIGAVAGREVILTVVGMIAAEYMEYTIILLSSVPPR